MVDVDDWNYLQRRLWSSGEFCAKCGADRGPTHPGGPRDPRICPLGDDCPSQPPHYKRKTE